MKKLLIIPLVLLIGCATLSPGSDPLVVRTEQGLAGANATFDFILNLDNNQRGFWRTNAPAFHNFCEWLRTPLMYDNQTNVPRCVLIQLNADDLKLRYKAAKTAANSNVLFTAVTTLEFALQQSSSWSNIVTQPTH